MMDQRLQRYLEFVGRRFRRFRFFAVMGTAWLLLAAAGWLIIGLHAFGRDPRVAAWALSIMAIVTGVVCVAMIWRSARDRNWLAQRIERRFPDLDCRLLAAVEQTPVLPSGRFGYLQECVIRETLQHRGEHAWEQTVPSQRIFQAGCIHFMMLAIFLFTLGSLFVMPAGGSSRAMVDAARVTVLDQVYSLQVQPGNAEVEKGTSVLVSAHFKPDAVPPEVTLVSRTAAGEERRVALIRSLDDPLFGARIPEIYEDLDYHVEFAHHRSDTYRLRVFEYPRLERADLELDFPDYTSLATKLIEDARRATAVEGTRVTILCHLNKPVRQAVLAAASGKDPLALVADTTDPRLYRTSITMTRSQRWHLQLTDEAGRANQQPPEFVLSVTPNRPPQLKLVSARDVEVSPIEELQLKANVWDDYGVTRYGLSYSLGGESPRDVVLGQDLARKQQRDIRHVLAFESLHASPDQLCSYYFWAEDIGPDGHSRRVTTDMYFAEVRPFDEIFRQGQQPPGGQSRQQQQRQQGNQNTQRAEELIRLQRQIISATWNLMRRETGNQPSDALATDAKTIAESQQDAQRQAEKLAEKLQDDQSRQFLTEVLDHMATAETHLNKAAEKPSPEPLPSALSAEQAASQALLRLRAREHQVIRSRQQSQRGQQSSRNSRGQRAQRQLQQLKLRDAEDRYETQRAAQQQQQQNGAQQETRQILNRLRELARRQDDLNKQLKQLQSELKAEEDQQKQEEIRRRLKRLQEQQQEILEDVDKLQERLDKNQDQQQVSDANQRLQETRSNVRRASQALKEGQVARAITEGTRANRQLEELREEFRKAASGEFAEEMRQMQQQAQQLDERQQKLAEMIDQLNRRRQTSLRDSGERENIQEGLGTQKKDLDKLLENMQQTIESAQEPEPLLANELFDTLRETRANKVDNALEVTRGAVEQGLLRDAAEEERKARAGIQQMREGVDRAAKKVLGDDTEALRLALDQLNTLSDQLKREIDQARGDSEPKDATPMQPSPGRRPPQNAAEQDRPSSGERPGDRRQDEPPGQRSGNARRPAERGQPDQRKQSANSQPNGQQRPGARKQGGQQPKDRAQPGQQQQPGGRQPQNGKQQAAGQQQRSGQQQPGGRPQPSDQRQPGSQRQPGRGQGQPSPGSQSPAQRPGNTQQDRQSRTGQPRPGERTAQRGPRRESGVNRGGGLGGILDQFRDQPGVDRPLTGSDFLRWSDRLRDVEEIVNDPQLRAEAARLRGRARTVRMEYKRHGKEPNWDLVQELIASPLNELRDRVAQELMRRESKDAVVPIDRDPVPEEFQRQVSRYYERLGLGK